MTPLDLSPSDLHRWVGQVAPGGRLNPKTVKQDIARLVPGLMEQQAIRQMELTAPREEQLGLALMRAKAALHDRAARFGLRPEGLALVLGPWAAESDPALSLH